MILLSTWLDHFLGNISSLDVQLVSLRFWAQVKTVARKESGWNMDGLTRIMQIDWTHMEDMEVHELGNDPKFKNFTVWIQMEVS